VKRVDGSVNIDALEIETQDDGPLELKPFFVDPYADLAVLGPLPDDFMGASLRINLSAEPLAAGTPIFVLDREGEVVAGEVVKDDGLNPYFKSHWERNPDFGSSGSGIVNVDGQLVGIHCRGGYGEGERCGTESAMRALPVWAYRAMGQR
jgi:hypothetical protein